MYTLLVIAWILCIIQNFMFTKTVRRKFGETAAWIVIFVSWITSFALTGGILSDVFGPHQTITMGSFIALSGPTNLAIQSLASSILTIPNKKKNKDGSLAKTLFDIISLTASILGIISFYLDYLVK